MPGKKLDAFSSSGQKGWEKYEKLQHIFLSLWPELNFYLFASLHGRGILWLSESQSCCFALPSTRICETMEMLQGTEKLKVHTKANLFLKLLHLHLVLHLICDIHTI